MTECKHPWWKRRWVHTSIHTNSIARDVEGLFVKAPTELVPMFWNPSTGRLCTAAQLIEWYHKPMTEEEKRHGFPYQGGFAGLK